MSKTKAKKGDSVSPKYETAITQISYTLYVQDFASYSG